MTLSTNWSGLERRLNGRLILPGEGAVYDEARAVFNARIDEFPYAVAYCASPEDVAACVTFCAANGIKAVARGGGHGALGYATRSRRLVIDQSAMQTIGVDPRCKTVTVGGGALWGQVDLATYPRGLAAPGGGCPQVGAGGLTQGGGFGPIARSHGLTCDNLIEAEVVLPRTGRLTKVSATEEPDLFWALRGGGGGNFGPVTSFKYGLYPIERALTAGSCIYDWKDALKLFQFYREWMTSNGDVRLTLLPIVGFDPDGNPTAILSVLYNGEWTEGYQLLRQIFADFCAPNALKELLGPTTLPAYAASDSTTGWPGLAQYWKSGYLENDFPDAAIDAMIGWMEKAYKPSVRSFGRVPGGTSDRPKAPDLSFAFIESLGGRIGEKRPTETAFFWRDKLFSFTLIGVCERQDTQLSAQLKEWADDFYAAMKPYLSGAVYVNYMQEGLSDWKRAYYGDNADRLSAIKNHYDPHHIFDFPQDLAQP